MVELPSINVLRFYQLSKINWQISRALAQALLPLVLLLILMTASVFIFGTSMAHGPAQLALTVSGLVAAGTGMIRGISYTELEQALTDTIRTAGLAIIVLLMIGALTGVCMASGVIPTFVYYLSRLVSPDFFFVSVFLICSLVSLATGSSWTTAAVIGVSLMGLSNSLGLPAPITAGAVISGVYLGDKLSPLSDTSNLASGLCDVDLVEHVRLMLLSSVPGIVLTIGFFAVLSLALDTDFSDNQLATLSSDLESAFTIDLVFIIPLLLMAYLIYRQAHALVTIALVLITSAVLGALYQVPESHDSTLMDVLYQQFTIYSGAALSGMEVSSGNDVVDQLTSKGGMDDILETIWLMVSAMFFGSMMLKAGLIDNLSNAILKRLENEESTVASAKSAALLTNIASADQYLSVVLPVRLFESTFRERNIEASKLSRAVEEGGTVTSPLIPWNTCAVFMAATLGVSTMAYLPFCIFNILVLLKPTCVLRLPHALLEHLNRKESISRSESGNHRS